MDWMFVLRKMQRRRSVSSLAWLIFLTLISTNLYAAIIDLSSVPVDIQQGVPPNILLTLDTSGSMGRFYLPDTIGNDGGSFPQDQNSDFNFVYYNPTITYKQGVDENGSTLPNGPTFSAAWQDGYNHNICSSNNTVDLSSQFPIAWGSRSRCNIGTNTAYYYIRNDILDPKNASSSCPVHPQTYDSSCYTKQVLELGKFTAFPAPTTRSDCTGTGGTCTLTDEQQNFANWYSYYRSRILMAKTTASAAFSTLSGSVRVTHQTLYTNQIPAITSFNGSDRTAFFNWLQNASTGAATPLRDALVRAGEFFKNPESSQYDPYVTTPGVSQTGSELSCRQNFNIMITDGMWNNKTVSTDPGDADGNSFTLPDKVFNQTGYTPQLPYSDGYTTTGDPTNLGDIAFYYWSHDLRADLDNNVPQYLRDTSTDYNNDGTVDGKDIFYNPLNDPADWQHMVNFTIPLGLTGKLSYDPSYYNTPFSPTSTDSNGNTITLTNNNTFTYWPEITDPTNSSDQAKVDDLWHAAINSRGGFYPATNPDTLINTLSSVLNSISDRNGSSSAPTASSSIYMGGTSIFLTSYSTSDWSGNVTQYDVDNLNANPATLPNAANQLNKLSDPNLNRHIYSYNTATKSGIEFLWNNLDSNEQHELNDTPSILSYIRGDQSNEQSNGGKYRNRASLLGDIVDSSAVYVGPPNLQYPDTLESSAYSNFVKAEASRQPMLYVGANDGMMHAFEVDGVNNSNSMKEMFAYVPTSVYPNLPDLTDPAYTHKFYVDGTPVVGDVFYNNSWHTILVGGLNAGGQGIYALDITNPTTFKNSTSGANNVLWEFTDADDVDMGYSYSQPKISKMNSAPSQSQWAVIFGNGYDDTATDQHVRTTGSLGDAVLYIVDVKTGAIIRKLDTGVGAAQDPLNKNRPNGLSTVALADVDNNYTTDYIYAGDLFGNLWKFDVSSPDPANWKVMTASDGITATPLFTTQYKDANGVVHAQPITSAPIVGDNALEPGLIINFGTGQELGLPDLTDTSLQSFYGVWDRNRKTLTTITRSDTLAQQILAVNTSQFSQYNTNARVSSKTSINWYLGTQDLPTDPSTDGYLGWRLDLVNPDGIQSGERVTTDPQRIGNRIIFVTNTPSSDPCQAGGSSWIMELNATTGQSLNTSPFDYNNDGHFSVGVTGGDLVQVGTTGGNAGTGGGAYIGSGIQIATGAGKLNGPTIMRSPTGGEVKIFSTHSGKLVKKNEPPPDVGVRSWIQLIP